MDYIEALILEYEKVNDELEEKPIIVASREEQTMRYSIKIFQIIFNKN